MRDVRDVPIDIVEREHHTGKTVVGLRIVLVDNHDDARELLADVLRRRGHATSTAADGQTAFAMIARDRPDAVVTELRLPDIDGVTLVERLRAAHPDLATRFIALTASGREVDERRTRAAGFVAHMVKPTSVGAILAAVAGDTTDAMP